MIVAALARAPIFSALAEADLIALAAVAELRVLAPDEALFRRGDPGDGLWVVTQGEVSIRVASVEGAVVVLNHLGAGDTVGEVALLDGGARSADATAVGSVQAVFLPRDAAMGVLALRPAALLAMLGVLCGRLRATSAQVESAADGALRAARHHGEALEQATDQNPLTRLPGNNAVRQTVEKLAAMRKATRLICYLDLDHFKPFNDAFGFRTGDDALFLCATTLRRHFAAGADCFIGHIGGDDFFLGLSGAAGIAVEDRIAAFRADFMRAAAATFYSAEQRAAGAIEGKDRDGNARAFPLLACSIAMLELPPGQMASSEAIGAAIAKLKSAAKAAHRGIARALLA